MNTNEQRIIALNRRDLNLLFPSNRIRTSKYNMLNFLPKAMLLQFMRVANIYFLVTAVLQSIPIISPLAPFNAISPLVFVLVVSLIREIMEDYRKHRNDDATNDQITFLFNNFVFQKILWKDVRVGDLIQVQDESFIPADLLLIRTSDENGICYVETSNLDGERNLKTKSALPEIQDLTTKGKFTDIIGQLQCDRPNNRIHKFQGTLTVDLHSYPVTNNNLLLRGTKLQNTKWVVGIVVYTGHDSKIVKNQGQTRYKTTHIEKYLNLIVIAILVLQAGSCLALAFFTAYNVNLFDQESKAQYSYIYVGDYQQTQTVQGLVSYFTFFLLLNTMVPISLIISLETLKWFQTMWMEFDEQLHLNKDEYFKVLNTLIHEELGKVDYIFTDKTGTLTCNNMVFRQCCIKGISYSSNDIDEIFNDSVSDSELSEFVQFWLCIILCHDVLIDEKNQEYQGSSPDEVALVKAASEFGFKFLKKTNNSIFIKLRNQMLIYELLTQIEFSSDRKRMSIIVKDMQNEKIIIYTKGADNIIWKRLDQKRHQEQELQLSQAAIKCYSKQGLRTLCMAYSYIEQSQFNDWQITYKQLINSTNIEDVDKLRQHESMIENDLILLGITALEDRLQDDVPETIRDLHVAGIKIWMLTGDKLETAENIGYLCNLLDSSTKCFKITTEDHESTLVKFKKIYKKISIYEKINKKPNNIKKNLLLQKQLQWLREQSSINSQVRSVHKRLSINIQSVKSQRSNTSSNKEKKRQYAMLIEGESIQHLLHSKEIQTEFLKIIPKCRTVICCRSTPNQKAEIVAFMKKSVKTITLAIGDGGNDVNMIQEAHIGVGILGKEGNQAAMSSDYFFCQFKYLWRLLFVHGRWNLYRTSYFVNFFFFKNILFTFQQFYFAFYSGFSGQTFFEDGYLLNFNTMVTAVAPVYYGVFDQDLNQQDTYIYSQFPRVYEQFKKYKLFGWRAFAKWYVSGLLCSAAIFFVTYSIYQFPIVDQSGRVDGLWQFSISCYWSSVWITFMVIISDSSQYTIITIISYGLLSIVAFVPTFTFAWNEFDGEAKHYAKDWLGNIKFYLVVALIVGQMMIFKLLVNYWQFMEYPTIVQVVLKEQIEYLNRLPTPQSSVNDISEIEIPISIQEENQIQGVYNLSHKMAQVKH